MNMRPLADRVVLKRAPSEERSKGGIYIPPSAQEKSVECIVVAVGPGRVLENGTRVAMDVQVGDRVLIQKWGGTEVQVDGEEHVVVRYDDIQGVLYT